MAPRLEDLPAELKLRIVGYIPRPSDLKAMCLTSQTLRVPATTRLYRRVKLKVYIADWRSEVDKVQCGFLSPTNPGLHQIRELRLISAHESPDEEEEEAVEKVLKALPPNVLRELNGLQRLSPVPSQRGGFNGSPDTTTELATLLLGPMTFNLAPFIKFGALGQYLCKNLTHLTISRTIGSLKDLDFYMHMIDQGHLQKLSFTPRRMHYESGDDDHSTETSITDQISSTLFHHIKERYSTSKLQLDRLCLGYCDVALSKFALPEYIDFSLLAKLVIRYCPEGGKLISLLAEQFEKIGSKLRYFEFRLGKGDSLSAKVVERFLLSFSGLRQLFLLGFDGGDNGYLGLDSAAFEKHCNTLEVLALHPKGSGNWSSMELGMEASFYFDISTKCRKLRQVAVPVSAITLPSVTEKALVEYTTPFIHLLSLPDLKVLRIFNWPSFAARFSSNAVNDSVISKLNTAACMQTMDYFVIKHISPIVNKSHPGGTTPIVCFNGFAKNTVSDGQSSATFSDAACYVPQRLRDVYGKENVALQKVDRSKIVYFEPECALVI